MNPQETWTVFIVKTAALAIVFHGLGYLLACRLRMRRWWKEVCWPLCECGKLATHEARTSADGFRSVTHYCREHAGADL